MDVNLTRNHFNHSAIKPKFMEITFSVLQRCSQHLSYNQFYVYKFHFKSSACYPIHLNRLKVFPLEKVLRCSSRFRE